MSAKAGFSSRPQLAPPGIYRQILVPLDGSEAAARALPAAERLSEHFDAELLVASFLPGVDNVARRERIISRQTTPLQYRPRTFVRPTVHSVADEISEQLDSYPDTLVVMATRAYSRLGPLMGSVAEKVLLSTRCPTLLVGPHASVDATWPSGRMFICTDRSETADAIIPVAADWHTNVGLHPWVIQVGSRTPFPLGPGDVGEETSGVRAVAQQLAQLTGLTADFDVLHGANPADTIVNHARHEGAALITLATHGATGPRRVALGSVAIAVVHDAACPVLVVRP